MRVVAIVAVRNEELYIGRCLDHLQNHGVMFVVVDNQSTDSTLELVNSFKGNGLLDVVSAPFDGAFDLVGQMKLKEEIARNIVADWIIHQDADEVLEPPLGGETLVTALTKVGDAGYNAVNFDEFCFIPFEESQRFEGTDYVAHMRHYFFFEPSPQRLLRAWRGEHNVVLSGSGGHAATFPGRRIWPENFVLRHYIGLSLGHLREKYARRRYMEREVTELGWHGWRSDVRPEEIVSVEERVLTVLGTDGKWDRSRPYKKHVFIAR